MPLSGWLIWDEKSWTSKLTSASWTNSWLSLVILNAPSGPNRAYKRLKLLIWKHHTLWTINYSPCTIVYQSLGYFNPYFSRPSTIIDFIHALSPKASHISSMIAVQAVCNAVINSFSILCSKVQKISGCVGRSELIYPKYGIPNGAEYGIAWWK